MCIGRGSARAKLLHSVVVCSCSRKFGGMDIVITSSKHLGASTSGVFLILSLFGKRSFEDLSGRPDATNAGDSIPCRERAFGDQSVLVRFSTGFSQASRSFVRGRFVNGGVRSLRVFVSSISMHLSDVRGIGTGGICRASCGGALGGPRSVGRGGMGSSSGDRGSSAGAALRAPGASRPMVIVGFSDLCRTRGPKGGTAVLAHTGSDVRGVGTSCFFGTTAVKSRTCEMHHRLAR